MCITSQWLPPCFLYHSWQQNICLLLLIIQQKVKYLRHKLPQIFFLVTLQLNKSFLIVNLSILSLIAVFLLLQFFFLYKNSLSLHHQGKYEFPIKFCKCNHCAWIFKGFSALFWCLQNQFPCFPPFLFFRGLYHFGLSQVDFSRTTWQWSTLNCLLIVAFSTSLTAFFGFLPNINFWHFFHSLFIIDFFIDCTKDFPTSLKICFAEFTSCSIIANFAALLSPSAPCSFTASITMSLLHSHIKGLSDHSG